MSYKSPLVLYNELIAAGVPEAQAQIQAQQDGELGDRYQDLNEKIEKTIQGTNGRLDKIEKDLYWMRNIGAGLMAVYIANLAGLISLIFIVK